MLQRPQPPRGSTTMTPTPPLHPDTSLDTRLDERRAEYRARKAHQAAVRAELAERRRHGLAQRHAQKLRNLAAAARAPVPDQDSRDTPTLLLTTTARHSCRRRRTPLTYREIAGEYVVVASGDGTPTDPEWYLNLTNNPNVHVHLRDESFPARARVANKTERTNLWPLLTEVCPNYDNHQTIMPHQISVVIISRKNNNAQLTEIPSAPPQPATAGRRSSFANPISSATV